MVVNTSAFFSPTSGWLKIEFAKLVALVHAQEKLFTIILESSLLDRAQTTKLIKLASDAGADFLKDQTGALPGQFSLDNALQFRRNVPSSVGVKIVADGATEQQMEALVAAGIERLALGHRLP